MDMTIGAILFDAYGTLLDVLSVSAMSEQFALGHGVALSTLWRDKQLQYTWLRTLSNNYVDFWQVTAEALDYSAAALGISLSPEQRGLLLTQYERLTAFPDAAPALDALWQNSVPLAVLSNGAPGMLEAAFVNVGLRNRFTGLLSVDTVRQFKPAPAAYQIAVDHFGVPRSDLLLVSSNGWDVAGAASFGMRTYWINRRGAPLEQLGVNPTGIGRSLTDLAPWLATEAIPPHSG